MININEVFDSFIGKVSEFKGEIGQTLSTLNNKISQLNNERAELLKAKEELADREANVKKIENVVSLNAEAQRMLKEAKEKMSLLSQSQDAFENYKNETMQEINKIRSELNEQGKYIKREYEFLQKAQKEFETEKAGFKDKVAKSIVELANKK